MNYFKSVYYLLILLILASCNSSGNSNKVYEQLGDNKAKISYKIDGKEFYPEESIFSGEVNASDKLLSITLADQFDGRSIISFGGDEWYVSFPSKKDVFSDNQVNAGIKMGKLTNKEKMIGEGFMMSEGTVTLEEFSKDKIVIKVLGKVGKYSDFEEPSEFHKLEGTIVYKKPSFSLFNVTEKELFSPLK